MSDKPLILESRCVEQSWIHFTSNSKYIYLLRWKLHFGFIVKRRERKKGWQQDADFWDRSRKVDDWIEMSGGMFSSSVYERKLKIFEGGDSARKVIREDILKNPID